MAQFYNAQESTYTIHPEHMAANKPRNCRDEDLIEGKEIIERPPDEPTNVMYLLQRVRLAEMCRELLDKNPLAPLTPENLEYDHVVEMDAKLNKFMQDLPPMLRLDFADSDHLGSTDTRLLAGISLQRYSINSILFQQRCKLHLPYLARGLVYPEFAESRKICLDSAKAIIHIERYLKLDGPPLLSSRLRMIMILRSVFLATIALVLDACLMSGSEGKWETEAEVAHAWMILQDAQVHSQASKRLLESSMLILRAHNVKHPGLEAVKSMMTPTISPQQPGLQPMTPDSVYTSDPNVLGSHQFGGPDLDTVLLDRQWQGLEGKMDLDAIDWDKLFWGLDAPII